MEFEAFVDATLKRQRKERLQRRVAVFIKLNVSCFLTILPFIISMWIYYKLSTVTYSCEALSVGELLFCFAVITNFLNLRDVFQRVDLIGYVESMILMICTAISVVVHFALFTTEGLDLLRQYIAGDVIDANVFFTVTHLAITFSVYSVSQIIAFYFFIKRNRVDEQILHHYELDPSETLKRVTQIVAVGYMFYALVISMFSLTTPNAFESKTISAMQARERAYVTAFVYGATAVANLLLIVGLNVRRTNVPEFTLRRANLLLVLGWMCLTILMTAMEMSDIYLWLTGVKDMPMPNRKDITVLIVAKIGIINYGMVTVVYYYYKELHALAQLPRTAAAIRTHDSLYAASMPGIPMPVLYSRGPAGEQSRNLGHETYI